MTSVFVRAYQIDGRYEVVARTSTGRLASKGRFRTLGGALQWGWRECCQDMRRDDESLKGSPNAD